MKTASEFFSFRASCFQDERSRLSLLPTAVMLTRGNVSGAELLLRDAEGEHAVLEMNWQKVSGQAVDSAAMATGMEPAGEAISESLQRDVLRSILTMIPAEDLGYLLEDIPAEDQAAILEEAAK